MAWDVEGGAPPTRAERVSTLPGSVVGTCPQERKQPLTAGHGGSGQLQGAGGRGLGRRGRCPSPPIPFFFPKAILGNRPVQDTV